MKMFTRATQIAQFIHKWTPKMDSARSLTPLVDARNFNAHMNVQYDERCLSFNAQYIFNTFCDF